MDGLLEVEIGKLVLPNDNIRQELGDLTELTASIKVHGVLEPVLVREDDLLIVCGSRRVMAASDAGLKTVPAILRPFSEQERLEAMIVENLQREDLSPLEEAGAFKRLVEMGLSQRQIATRVGCSQAHVSKRLQLLALPETVQKAVDTGHVSLEQAAQFSQLNDDPELVKRLADSAKRQSHNKPAVSYEVDRELARRQKVADLAKARKELAKGKDTVVEVSLDERNPYTQIWPDNTSWVSTDSYDGTRGAVVMDPKKHAKLGCHALAVHPQTLEVIEACTNANGHPDPQADRQKEQDRQRAKRQKEQEQRKSVRDARFESLRILVQRPDVVLEASFLALFEDYHAPLAAWLLDKDAKVEDVEDEALLDQLQEQAGQSLIMRQRVTLAFAFAQLEHDMDSWNSNPSAYLRLLEKHGHKLSDLELQACELSEQAAAEAKQMADDEDDEAGEAA